MDYLKVYKHFYDKTHIVIKRMVINEMQKAKLKNRPFLSVHNKITAFLFEYKEKNYTQPMRNHFGEPYRLFQNKYSYYKGELDDIIQWILEDEILHAYDNNQSYSYKNFIADLAIEDSINYANNHFINYRDFYKLIYLQDKYQYFYFEYFDRMLFENSKEYIEMMDIEYPDRIKNRELLEVEDKNKSVEEKILNGKLSDENSDYLQLLNYFEDNERYLLLNILHHLCVKSEPVSVIDFARLVRIVGTFNDLSLFSKNIRGNTTYTKINKGLEYYSGKSRLNIIESTLNKLEPFKIDVVEQQLKKMRLQELQNKHKNRKQ